MNGPLRWLLFSVSEGSDGVFSLEAEAASRSMADYRAIVEEAKWVLRWATLFFPDTCGAVEEGADWDEHLSHTDGPDGWQTLSLHLSASPRFLDAFIEAFGDPRAA